MAVKWIDQSQPQTLQSATILMYINAVFDLIFREFLIFGGIGLLFLFGPVIAALGIANEKKWGYWVGIILTALTVGFLVSFFSFGLIITLIFYIALLCLLLHPMSRSYYKTWFR